MLFTHFSISNLYIIYKEVKITLFHYEPIKSQDLRQNWSRNNPYQKETPQESLNGSTQLSFFILKCQIVPKLHVNLLNQV